MAGKTGSCPKCQSRFMIPAATTADPLTPPRVPSRSNAEIQPCPGCRAKLTVAASDLGLDVECPYCKSVYRAMAGTTAAKTPASRRARQRLEDDIEDEEDRPRYRDEDDGDDDEIDRRRRRRRRHAAAEEAVSAPAIGLMVVGALVLLYGIAVLAINMLDFNNQKAFAQNRFGGNRNQNNAGFQVGFQIGYVAATILPVISGLGMITAGINLKRLKMQWTVWFGSIIAMLPCSICCLLGLPFGIWTITVLNRPDVKRAFE